MLTPRSSLPLLLLAVIAAPAPAQAPPLWPVSAKPTVTIGVEEGELEYEFSGVTGARRLSNGMIVIANSKPLELRLYDAKGKFLRRIGRSGNGPGEFRGEVFLLPAAGDSIVVFVNGRGRNISFGVDGTLLHEEVIDGNITSKLEPVALSHRTYMRVGGTTIHGCMRPVLAALPMEKDPMLRDLYSDAAGRSWVREFGAAQFTIFSPAARSIGRAVLPRDFEPTQIAGDFILGVGRLADDIEQVQLWRVIAPAAGPRPPCLGQVDSFPVPRDPRVVELRMLVRNAATGLEAAQMRYKHYPLTADSINLELPPNIIFKTLRHGGDGFVFGLFDQKSPLFCVMAVGTTRPAGWSDGMYRCGM